MSCVPQPPLSELLERYLQKQTAAHECGMSLPEGFGEVLPYDAAPAQPIDPRTAWTEAVRALNCFHDTPSVVTPPEWPTLVVTHEPETALAFAAGNFPQLVRNLLPLWQTKDLKALCPRGTAGAPAVALVDWATEALRKAAYPQCLLAVGALRLAHQFDAADELMSKHAAKVPMAWQAAWANEKAALAWHCGRTGEAAESWQEQEESVPVLFNRGMAATFLERPSEARPALETAVSRLPESDAWHHLGRLYLALAELA